MGSALSEKVYSRRDVLKLTGLTGIVLVGSSFIAGCSSGTASSAASSGASSSAASSTTAVSGSSAAAAALAGKKLNIYCGAGMTDPFQEIADAFSSEAGCEMVITFDNAAGIQNKIKETQSGDFFIAGSADELKPVQDFVRQSEDLVKHIPVIAVPSENRKGIKGLADLANCDTLLIGDPESTPIGKIAKKALTDAGIWDALEQKGAITTTTTAPQISAALAKGEGDAGIVWKENVKADGAKVLETADMDKYVKTVPTALLTCAGDADAAQAFLDYLGTSAAQGIWQKYGYELV